MSALIEWHVCAYNDLTLDALYQLLALRQAVFIVEQDCPYLDADGVDQFAHHLLGWADFVVSPNLRTDYGVDEIEKPNSLLSAYCRIVEPGKKYVEPSLGRVITAPHVRGAGVGRQLMAEAMTRLQSLYPSQGVRISAQQYLVPFYSEFGFEPVSEPYDEDGIPHVEMFKRP